MIQLDEGARSPDSPTDVAAADEPRALHPIGLAEPAPTAQQPTAQQEEADTSVGRPFVSPPSPPWPRIFPQL
jgi:hypothetical protein